MRSGPILVLFADTGSGHRAAAKAIAEAARARGHEVELLDAFSFTPQWFARAYVDTYDAAARWTPRAYGAGFAALNRAGRATDPFRRRLDRAVDHQLVQYVLARRPLAIIATHFHPLLELGRLRHERRTEAKLVAVVTDYVAHAMWAARGVDVYCTAHGKAAQDLHAHGTFGAPIVETGIPIRRAFARVRPWRAPKEGEPLRVLVTSGGAGVGPIIDVMRSFRRLERVHLDVVCGRRRALVKRALRVTEGDEILASVTGFVDDIPRRIAAAHVVVGKSGGLTMSECLAAGRPLVVVGVHPGQEQGNLEQLEAWDAGIACRSDKVGTLVQRLLEDGALARMAEHARAHGCPDAAERVLSVLDDHQRNESTSMQRIPA